MGRPAKITQARSRHDTKADIDARRKAEQKLANPKPPRAPKWLTPEQRKMFRDIYKKMGQAEILSVADEYILADAAVTFERLFAIEQEINEDPKLKYNSKVIACRNSYTKDFYRCCNELCLSPQARAKMSAAVANGAKEGKSNPLLDILLEDD